MADLVYAICLLAFASASVWLSIVDFREMRLPNRIVWPLNIGLAVGLGIHSFINQSTDAYLRALLAAGACFSVFFLMRFISPSSMGFGDVKLSIAIGLMLGYLSWAAVLNGIFCGFIAAAVFAMIGLAFRKLTMKGSLAFGPFMLLGAWIALLT
jgi:leader peptidase (prepilin peptidase)/N-methyltransferase